MPIFQQIMSRDKYLAILRMLHFSHNETIERKLYEIRAVVDFLRQSFKTNFVAFILFKGRLKVKQYNSKQDMPIWKKIIFYLRL